MAFITSPVNQKSVTTIALRAMYDALEGLIKTCRVAGV
jgi:hypothetical protein